MTDLTVFREYEPHECGPDGYPLVWHRNCGELATPIRDMPPATGALDNVIHELLDHAGPDAIAGIDFHAGVKHIVRAQAGNRCVRCLHPYRVGSGAYTEVEEHAARALDVGDPDAPQLTWGSLADPGQVSPEDRASVLRPGAVNWSPCDEYCTHDGPVRARFDDTGQWVIFGELGKEAGSLLRHPGRGSVLDVHAAWRILTVHHLNGRKHDLRWWNLASLCQRCHLVIQRKVVMERVYPFEHTGWFRPYAAGWYAYAYEGRSITRDEALRRQDELLALERMA